MNPTGLAIAAGATAAGSTFIAQLADGKAPQLRVAFGGLGIAVALSALAGPAPELATRASMLVIVAALLANASQVLAGWSRLIGAPTP